jgi:hypothetical protein
MTYTLIALLIIPVYFYYRKTLPDLKKGQRIALAILRWLSISLILLILLNPILYLVHKATYKPELLILHDTSNSMNIVTERISKTNAISSAIQALKEKYAKAGYKIVEDSFADGYRGKPNSTNLVRSLEEMSQSGKLTHTSKILLASDGWFRDEELDFLNDLKIPFYTFNPVSKPDSTDLQISYLKYDRIAYKNEKTPVYASISASQYIGKAIVKLLVNKKQSTSQVVDFKKGSFQQVLFEPVFAQTGLQPIEVQVELVGRKERNTENNNYPGAIQVLSDKSRILFLADNLSWDVKFIQDAIRTNARWRTDVFQVHDGQIWKGNRAVPVSDISALTFESIILVNSGNLILPENLKQLINNTVKRGCGLFVMGKPMTNLGDLLPAATSNISSIYQSGFKLNPSAGAFSFLNYDSKTISDIPPIQYYYVQPRQDSSILGTIDNDQHSPAILYHQFGKGKVLEFAFLDLWKWQMWSDNGEYQTFVCNLLLWLGNQEQQRFLAQTTKNSYFLGEEIHIHLNAVDDKQMTVNDVDARVQVTNSSRRIVFDDYLVKKGDDFQVQLPRLNADNYKFKVFDEKTRQHSEGAFIVTSENLESRDFGFNQPLLFYISQTTNGKSFTESEISSFKPIKEQAKAEEKRFEIPLYRKWYLIALFLICFCLELFLRRYWGLL